MNRILVPVDFSDITEPQISVSVKMVKAFKGKLYILHVEPPDPFFVGYSAGPQCERDCIADQIKKNRSKLEQIKSELTENNIDIYSKDIQGPTTDKILNEAIDFKADLIILGFHKHGVLKNILQGNIIQDIINRSSCPVMLIPGHNEKK